MAMLGMLEVSNKDASTSICVERDENGKLYLYINDDPIVYGERFFEKSIFSAIASKIEMEDEVFTIRGVGRVLAHIIPDAEEVTTEDYSDMYMISLYELYPIIVLDHGGFKNFLKLLRKLNIKYYRRGD